MNSLDLISERQCAAVYRAFEARNLTRAIAEADKLLRKLPQLHLATALKALAAAQIGKRKEASTLCDGLLALKQAFTPAVVLPLSHALTALNRDLDTVTVLEAANKAHPDAEDVAEQCFFALIKAQLYQRAQQAAQRMHKSFKKDLYFWWSIQAYELLASRQPQAQGAALALPLCERMLVQHLKTKPLTGKSDELAHLYVTILHKLGKDKEALEVLAPSSDIGAQLCKRSLALELMRRELWTSTGAWEQVWEEAMSKLKAGETDWAYIYALCQASAQIDRAASSSTSASRLKDARRFLQERLHSDRFSRVGSLATLETFAQQKLLAGENETLPSQTQEMVRIAIEAHLEAFGSKACGAGDVMPYLLELLSDSEREQVRSSLAEQFSNFQGRYSGEEELARQITSLRLLRALEARAQAKPAFSARQLTERYAAGLPLGAQLPETEGQPADELGILAAQSMLEEATSEDLGVTIQAAAFLNYACRKSQKAYRLRVFLVRLLLQLGLFRKAAQQWDHLKAVFIQHDTLGHLLLDHTPIYAQLGGVEAAEVVERVRQAQTLYQSNERDTNEMIKLAFQQGTFSKIEEVVDFSDRVNRSFSRQLYRLDRARIALLGQDGSAQPSMHTALASVQGEVSAVLTTLREGALCDQRDFTILPVAHAAQPHFQPEPRVLLGGRASEADIFAEAATMAIACDFALLGKELSALRSYEGESKPLLTVALALHGLNGGQATADEFGQVFDTFISGRSAAIAEARLPWRVLQEASLVLRAVALLKLAAHQHHNIAETLTSLIASSSSQTAAFIDAADKACTSLTKALQTAQSQVKGGEIVAALRADDESAAASVEAFMETTVDAIEEALRQMMGQLRQKLPP